MMGKIQKITKHINFLKRKPFLVMRILNGYFKTVVLRQNVLRSVELAITFKCNAKCKMCYASKMFNANKQEINVGQIKGLWKRCLKLGAIHVNLTGGEPMLRKDVYAIIKALQPNKTLVSLVTNASLINEDAIKKLKEAGLNSLQISIDDVNPQIHNKLRGIPNLLEKVINGAKLAKKYGIVVCLSTVISHENIKNKSVKDIIKLAEDLDVFLLINLAATAGGWSEKDSVILNKEDNKILQEIMSHPLTRIDTMFNFRLKSGCPAGIEKMYISAYGDVMPCCTTQVSFGNIFKEPIEKIWKKMGNFPFYKMKSKVCLRHNNREYIKNFIEPICSIRDMPVPIYQHPNKDFQKFGDVKH